MKNQTNHSKIVAILNKDACTGKGDNIIDRLLLLMDVRNRTWKERVEALHKVDYYSSQSERLLKENFKLKEKIYLLEKMNKR